MEELKHYADEACQAAEMQSQGLLARETALQATVQDLTAARAADASGHAVSLQEVSGLHLTGLLPVHHPNPSPVVAFCYTHMRISTRQSCTKLLIAQGLPSCHNSWPS